MQREPLTSTDAPSWSLKAGDDETSFASSVHVVPERAKAYAAPESTPPVSSRQAPTIATSPSSATATPN